MTKNPARKLTVRRETLKTLTRDRLAAVAAGATPTWNTTRSAICSNTC